MSGAYPDFSIDYEKFLASNGPLREAIGAMATVQPTQDILFTWADNSKDGTEDHGKIFACKKGNADKY
ncbi:MAG: DUF6266 family protein [Ginsengibacter sp.]